ncbi:MAG: ThiF family adenylyltransferase [Paucimonas sp.]|jgi:hypothetical protein|nr:ThiF family adenylyltransferase [Paucimonas sp.]
MDDLVFYRNGTPVGLVTPSLLHAAALDGKYINGPKGIVALQGADEASLHEALVSAGALVPGSEDDIRQVKTALREPATSRTVSYLLCNADTCADVIRDLKSLHAARVVIAGCGGIGSMVAMLLAGSGIKKLTLIDPDVVEASNLNRQLFWTLKHVGQAKVVALQEALEARFEHLELEIDQANVTIDGLIATCSAHVQALVVTADNPGTLANESGRVCDECGIAVFSGGYIHDTLLSFSYMPNTHSYFHGKPLTSKFSWERLPNAIMPSYGPVNVALAAEIAANVIRAISNSSLTVPEPAIKCWKIGQDPVTRTLDGAK